MSQDFQNVAETFAINFDKYTEIGSSLCVIADGEVNCKFIYWAYIKSEKR